MRLAAPSELVRKYRILRDHCDHLGCIRDRIAGYADAGVQELILRMHNPFTTPIVHRFARDIAATTPATAEVDVLARMPRFYARRTGHAEPIHT
jgi:hypothetical protein